MLTQQTLVARRPVGKRDEPLLRELFESTRDELELLPADVRYVLIDMQFRAQRRHYAASYPSADHDVLVVDGAEVGRIVVDDSGPVLRIIDITVRRGYRGKHIATTVLTDLIAEAEQAERPTEVVVWTGNGAARRTCETLGFSVAFDEDGYLTMRR